MSLPPALLRLTPPRREREIQAAVLAYLRSLGIIAWPMQRERAGRARASHIGFKGIPDLMGLRPSGRALFVEVKRPGAKPTPYQRAMRLLAERADVYLVHSLDEAREKIR